MPATENTIAAPVVIITLVGRVLRRLLFVLGGEGNNVDFLAILTSMNYFKRDTKKP